MAHSLHGLRGLREPAKARALVLAARILRLMQCAPSKSRGGLAGSLGLAGDHPAMEVDS